MFSLLCSPTLSSYVLIKLLCSPMFSHCDYYSHEGEFQCLFRNGMSRNTCCPNYWLCISQSKAGACFKNLIINVLNILNTSVYWKRKNLLVTGFKILINHQSRNEKCPRNQQKLLRSCVCVCVCVCVCIIIKKSIPSNMTDFNLGSQVVTHKIGRASCRERV